MPRFGVKGVADILFFDIKTKEVAFIFGYDNVKDEVNKLIKSRNKTKKKRIRKKINKRINTLLKR